MKKPITSLFCALVFVLLSGVSCTEKGSGELPPFPGGEDEPDPTLAAEAKIGRAHV